MFARPSPTMATPAYRPTTSLGTNFADLDVASTPLGIGYIVLTNRARHPAWKLGGIMRIGLVGYGVGVELLSRSVHPGGGRVRTDRHCGALPAARGGSASGLAGSAGFRVARRAARCRGRRRDHLDAAADSA